MVTNEHILYKYFEFIQNLKKFLNDLSRISFLNLYRPDAVSI